MTSEPKTVKEWEQRIREKLPLPHHCVVCGHCAGRVVDNPKLPDTLQCDDGFLVTDNYTCDRWIPPEGEKSLRFLNTREAWNDAGYSDENSIDDTVCQFVQMVSVSGGR